ncbi:MAG: hypothetical protein U0R52_13510 [Solirubrobacterales bacterium]
MTSGHRGAIVPVLAAAALALAALLLPAAAGAGGKPAPARLHVKVKTDSQKALTRDGNLDLTVTSDRSGAVKVGAFATQGGRRSGIAKARTVGLRAGIPKPLTLKLTQTGRSLVASCISTRLTATARAKGRGGGSVAGAAQMRRDPAQCNGKRPVGVDIADAAKCDPIAPLDSGECLFPYPNDYYTVSSSKTDTGKRLAIAPDATPANTSDVHVNPSEINTSDGFSPGAPVVAHVPGMDTPQAFANTGAVPITEMSKSFDPNQPVVVIDASTGDRQLIWTELDSNASTPADTDLLIHWGRNLLDGHRYVVALRNLKNGAGKTIPAPPGFRLYRDRIPTAFPVIEKRRAHMENVFAKLKAAGIGRSGLYMAWDFTVASTRNLSERMLHIRDDALAQLGDTTPGDGIIQGDAPHYTITDVKTVGDPVNPLTGSHATENVREVTGTFDVPCYIHPDCEAASAGRFSPDANGLPTQATGAGSVYHARFTCNIPQSAVTPTLGGDPGDYTLVSADRPSMYGHGLFGDYGEVHTKNVRQLGNDHNVITCATDWIGMYEDDVGPEAVPALLDMSKFPPLPDRLQQGFLDFIYLGRLLANPDGLADDPAFEFDGGSALATDKGLFYYGNSQGGIAGGALTAVEPDITRTVLYVPGMNYSTLLTRSVDFDDYALVLYPSYPDEGARPLLLSLIQSMWDRGEPDGYANHMTSDPLPNTPAHHVLIDMAYGDHQVANVQTEVEARTIGAPLRGPALDSFRLPTGFVEPYYDIPALGDLSGPAADGNALFVWDIGPKREVLGTTYGTDPAPITNTSPDDSFGVDPHDTVIDETPIVRAQIAEFLKVGGKVVDPCGPMACYAAGWTGPPPGP